jgi:hypothetical protein
MFDADAYYESWEESVLADEIIDGELGLELIAKHDDEDYDAGYDDYPDLNEDMVYSPAYVSGFLDANECLKSVYFTTAFHAAPAASWFSEE